MLGDTHASVTTVDDAYRVAAANECDKILQVGDFGYWPRIKALRRFLSECSNRAVEYGIPLYWIDGNHEDFGVLLEHGRYFDGPRETREGVYWMSRGLTWDWAGVRFCALGGGSSIDRHNRTLGQSWFLEEVISDEDVERTQPCDVLVTHDAPYNVAVANGGRLIDDPASVHCQQQIQRALNKCQPELLVHGHWHMIADVEWLRTGGYTRCVGLSCNHNPGNMAILTLDAGEWELEHLTDR